MARNLSPYRHRLLVLYLVILHFLVYGQSERVSRIVTPNETLEAKEFPFVIDCIGITGIEEVNDSKDLIELSVKIRNGTLQYIDTFPGLWIRSEPFSVEATITGLSTDLQSFIDAKLLAVNPMELGWTGISSIDITATDALGRVISSQIRLRMDPDISFEFHLTPDSSEMEEDGVLSFDTQNITMSMPPALYTNVIACRLEVTNGKLKELKYEGSAVEVLREFKFNEYRPNINYHGVENVTVICENHLGQKHATSFMIDISPVNDEPKIMLPNKSFEMNEDSQFNMGTAGFYIFDADAREWDGTLIAVDLEMTTGELILPPPDRLEGLRTVRRSLSTLRLIGQLDRVNIAIQFIFLTFPNNWFGSDILNIKCTDSVGFDEKRMEMVFSNWVHDHIHFTVKSVNDIPQVFVNRTYFSQFVEGDIVRFGHNAIELRDVDAEHDAIYSLSLTFGEDESNNPGAFVVDNGDSASGKIENLTTVDFNGTLSNLSESLERTALVLKKAWFGISFEGLSIRLTNPIQGATTESITISVAKKEDRPAISASSFNFTMDEDSPLALSKLGLSVLDSDYQGSENDQSIFKASVSSSEGGSFQLDQLVAGTFFPNAFPGAPSNEILFWGPLHVINRILAESLIYFPPKDSDTFDVLRLLVHDDTDLSDNLDIHIHFEAVNDSPTINEPFVEKSIASDGAQTFFLHTLRVDDCDSDQTKVTFSLQPPFIGELRTVGGKGDLRLSDDIRGQYHMEGALENVNAAIYSLAIDIEEGYVGAGDLRIESNDNLGGSSSSTLHFHVEGLSKLPIPVKRNTSDINVSEDDRIIIGDIIGLNATSTDPSQEIELRISTWRIILTKVFIVNFKYPSSCKGGGQSYFHFWFGSEKTDKLRLNCHLREMAETLMALRSISAAHLSHLKEDGTSFEVRLLVFSGDRNLSVSIDRLPDRQPNCKVSADVLISNFPKNIETMDTSKTWESHQTSSFLFEVKHSNGIHFPNDDISEGPVESVTMIGRTGSMERALGRTILIPPSGFSGKVRINVVIQGKLGAESVERNVDVRFTPVDDAPAILWNESRARHGISFLELKEDSDIYLDSMTVDDADNRNKDAMEITLNTKVGWLCYTNRINSLQSELQARLFIGNNNGGNNCTSNGIQIKDKKMGINKLLKAIMYKPKPNWWGVDSLEIDLKSQKNHAFSSMDIFVTSISDKPDISIASHIATFEDTAVVIGNISISDADINTAIVESQEMCVVNPSRCHISVELKASFGRFSCSGAKMITSTDLPGKIRLRGSQDDMNSVLYNGIVYKPNNNFSGLDKIQIKVTDSDGKESSEELEVFVEPVHNIPPKIIAHQPPVLTVKEDRLGIIGTSKECDKSGIHIPLMTCESIQIVYSETESRQPGGTITVMLISKNGKFRLPQLRFSKNTVVLNSDKLSYGFMKSICIRDHLEAINTILIGMHFMGDANFNTEGGMTASIHIAVKDDTSSLGLSETVHIAVTPVNDSPILKIRSGLYSQEISTKTNGVNFHKISSMPLVLEEDTSINLGISITDFDAHYGEHLLEVNVRTIVGHIFLPKPIAWIEDKDRISQNISLQIHVEKINEFLRCLEYKPRLNFFGNDTLTVKLLDLGQNTLYSDDNDNDFPTFVQAEVPIIVHPVPDLPFINGPTFFQMEEDKTEIISFQVEHPDVSDIFISIRYSNTAKISLFSQDDLMINTTDGLISGIGSLTAWNNALSRLLYTPQHNWNTDDKDFDTIEIQAKAAKSDHAETQSFVTFISITGHPDLQHWNVITEPPVSSLSLIGYNVHTAKIPYFEVPEDGNLVIPLSLFDADFYNEIPDETYSVRISTTSGSIQLNSYSGIFITSGAPGSNLLQFEAAYTSINNAVNQLSYSPLHNFNGQDKISLFASSHQTAHESLIDIPVFVSPQSDIPSVKAPNIIDCNALKACVMSDIFVDDPDNNEDLTLSIQAANGRLAFKGDNNISYFRVSLLSGSLNGDSAFTMGGSKDSLNSILELLVYIPSLGGGPSIGSITFNLAITENTTIMNSELHITSTQVFMTNLPEKQLPPIKYKGVTYNRNATIDSESIICSQNENCAIDGFTIDGSDFYSIFKVELCTKYNKLSINGKMKETKIFDVEKSSFSCILIHGKIAQLNKALGSLTLMPMHHHDGKDNICLSFSFLENSSKFHQIHSFNIDITITNAKSHFHLIGPDHLHFVNEDQYLSINGISILHNNDTFVKANLKVLQGRFHLPYIDNDSVSIFDVKSSPTGHLWFIENSESIKDDEIANSWWIRASLCVNINDVADSLKTISFIPDQNWNSAAGDYTELIIDVYRLDEGCRNRAALSSTGHIGNTIKVPIHVTPVNDPPLIKISYDAGKGLNHSQSNNIVHLPTKISDVDNTIIKVDIKTNGSGKIAVFHGHGHFKDAYFTKGDGSGTYFHNITLMGTMEAVNDYLQNLHYRRTQHHKGERDTVSLVANDQLGGMHSIDVDIL